MRSTQLAYRDALNYVSKYAYEHGKMSSGRTLQQNCYDDIRLKFGLPAQMACNVPRQVAATYKGLWTKVKQNAAARKAGLTKNGSVWSFVHGTTAIINTITERSGSATARARSYAEWESR